MGDMKTPDFDDLLAAFDIPDATGLDAKEPIQGSHEDTDSQLKHTGICLGDSLLSNQGVTAADVPAVSVIVKNTSRQESLEDFEPALQNGFSGQDTSIDNAETANTCFSKSFVSALNGDNSSELLGKPPIHHKPDGTPLFTQTLSDFSPISSPESEDTLCSIDEMHPKQDRPCFPQAPDLVEPSIPDNQKKLDFSMFDECPKDYIPKNTESSGDERSTSKESSGNCVSNKTDKIPSLHSALPPLSINQSFNETNCNSDTTLNVPTYPHVKSETSKLSSCLEALVALNARKDPSEQIISSESSAIQNDCVKASPNVLIFPQSPLEAVKQLMKPSDSPVSICSDTSGKVSPAVATGSPPAIPRVRIKTIKTTTGQIKRTVTSVLPDSETDEIHSAYETSPSQSMISEDSYCNMSPHQSQSVSVDSVVGLKTKVMPASTSSPKVLRNKSEVKSRRSGITECATVFHNTSTSGAVKRSAAHQGQKPKRGSATTGNTTATSFLPKAMHLASLNLVPHSVAASVAARSTSHQPSKPTLSSKVDSTVPLVHQVKSANPYPRTSVPNTAAGTLNRLLNNANPVPTYVPNLNPPPESNINLPPRGYCCLECGDSFGVESSLAYHYSRRSVHIEVGCTHCAKTIVFFNKCALLAHAREHKNNGLVMQCTQLHMKPIAEEHMFVPQGAVNVDSYNSPSLKRQPVLPQRPDNVIRHRPRCLECSKQLSDYKALASHYQRPSDDVEGLMCKVCSMLLPNKCSFKAHQRIHAHKSPYCCPECGAQSCSADIQKHVRENCLHYARKAWYKCLHCDMVFKTLQGQKTHIEEKHCGVFYKCSLCSVAFKTSESCELHLKTKHSASKTTPLLIFRCSCEMVFKKKHSLFQHFHQNANKRVTCVFKCPECNSVFPQKQLLMQHFKTVHVGNMTAETEKTSEQTDNPDRYQGSNSVKQQKSRSPVKHTDSPRKKAEQNRRPRVKPTGWTCGECLQWFPERDSYVSHVKTNHRKSMKKYPCRHCEQSFSSTTSLRRHIRNDHDGKKKIYTCWYCMDTRTVFTTSVMLKNHISLMHGIKNPDLGQMLKTAIQESKKAFGKGFLSKRPAVDTQAGGQDGTSAKAHPSKRLKTQFRCSKCGFVTDDSPQFQQHIPQHKTDENTPQCRHCGLCFTSLLSLNRHLFIVHKVKDTDGAKKRGEEDEAEVREKVQVNQPVRSADTDEVNDLLPELNEPSQAGEPAAPHCDKTSDCHLKQSTHTPIQEVSLR
ncbi:zinc finger protein 592 [Clinocottus analis]|uniref:zinc finger protein 592 n=1 Tax=Clinocottus analis TaxID=304258 RepID=UPI0035BECFF1